MPILGADDLTRDQVALEVRNGGRFVVFLYCVSLLVVTFRRGSDVHFLRPGEGSAGKSIGYTLLTLVLGWWGIPWGPIYTVQCLFTNLSGGKDVTGEVMTSLGLPYGPAATQLR